MRSTAAVAAQSASRKPTVIRPGRQPHTNNTDSAVTKVCKAKYCICFRQFHHELVAKMCLTNRWIFCSLTHEVEEFCCAMLACGIICISDFDAKKQKCGFSGDIVALVSLGLRVISSVSVYTNRLLNPNTYTFEG